MSDRQDSGKLFQPNLCLTYDFISAINPFRAAFPLASKVMEAGVPSRHPAAYAEHTLTQPIAPRQDISLAEKTQIFQCFHIGQEVISFEFEQLRSRRRAWEPSESSKRNILLILN